jgi:hypothetical protein
MLQHIQRRSRTPLLVCLFPHNDLHCPSIKNQTIAGNVCGSDLGAGLGHDLNIIPPNQPCSYNRKGHKMSGLLRRNEYKVSPCPTPKQSGTAHDIGLAEISSTRLLKCQPSSKVYISISHTRWDGSVHLLCIIFQDITSLFCFTNSLPTPKWPLLEDFKAVFWP